jgi:hypothetical protein
MKRILGFFFQLVLIVWVEEILPQPMPDNTKHSVAPVYTQPSLVSYVAQSKNSRSSVRRKMQSSLIELIESYDLNHKQFIHTDTNKGTLKDTLISSQIQIDTGNRVHIYMYLKKNVNVLNFVKELKTHGLSPYAWNNSVKMIQAWVKIDSLEIIGKEDEIRYLAPVSRAITGGAFIPPTDGSIYIRSDVSRQIWPTADGRGITVGVLSNDCGSKTSTPDDNDGANEICSQLKPLVLDDTYNYMQSPISKQHEGLAMMEIINGIAPAASLAFASGCNGIVSFINNLDSLVNHNCKVITDDVFYEDEPAFNDGEISKKIDAIVAANKVVYTTMAGNFSTDIFSFRFLPVSSNGLTFLPDNTVIQSTQDPNFPSTIQIPANTDVDIVLQWDDPYNSSENDFDLYVVDLSSPPNLLGESTTIQSPNNQTNACEIAHVQWASLQRNVQLYIARTGNTASNLTPRMKIFVKLGSGDHLNNQNQEKSITGHSACKSAITCGAIGASLSGYSTIEGFSSRGPVEIVDLNAAIANNGNRPIAEKRLKPEVTSIDNVTTQIISSFIGTSASAPHVAGLAAQLLSLHNTEYPNILMNPDDVKKAICNGCIDYGTPGWDPVYGYGRTDAFRTLAKWLCLVKPKEHFALFESGTLDAPKMSMDGPTEVIRSITLQKEMIPIHHAYISVTIERVLVRNLKIELTSSFFGTGLLWAGSQGDPQALDPNIIFSDDVSVHLNSLLSSGSVTFGLVQPVAKIIPNKLVSLGLKNSWGLNTYYSQGTAPGVLIDWGIYVR